MFPSPYNHEIQEIQLLETSQENNTSPSPMDHTAIYIPTIQRELIIQNTRENRFFDFLRARPSNSSDPNNHRRINVFFIRKIQWRSLVEKFKKWIRNPSNIAIFIWLVFVAIGLIILLLLMIGILDKAIPSSSTRRDWSEVVNQILNALFTIMCLYTQPRLIHHLVKALRWRPKDRVMVREIYCKNGSQGKNEKWHLCFVVFLLNLTCFAQYFCCALFWAYNRHNRPNVILNLGYAVGLLSPVIAGLYVSKGPLKRKPNSETGEIDPENQISDRIEPELDQSEPKTHDRRFIVTRPEWIGGLFDCWDDLTVFFLSTCCTFCVFGWNMERLGFGNMYVHIFTFLLFCIAPFLIFDITALNIDDETIGYIFGVIGIILCFFGLLYGGFWRIQMRKRFKLPENTFCGVRSSVADCAQWLFCCACSLAQEVRTGNFYDVEEDMLFRKVVDGEGRTVLVPVPRESGMNESDSFNRSTSCPPKIGPNGLDFGEGVRGDVLQRVATYGGDHAMRPPFPALIETEKN